MDPSYLVSHKIVPCIRCCIRAFTWVLPLCRVMGGGGGSRRTKLFTFLRVPQKGTHLIIIICATYPQMLAECPGAYEVAHPLGELVLQVGPIQ